MHKINLSTTIIERVKERRGRLQLFEAIEPAATALLVVDMQNGFCKKGYPAFIPAALEVVPNINRLARAMRETGGLVVWIQMAATAESIRDWSVFFDFHVRAIREQMIESLTPGRPGYELWHELDVQPTDLKSVKTRFSAMLPESSDLHERLRSRDIDTVIVTGMVSNVCSEATARDATMLNYKTIFVADANAARNDEEHNATLNNLLNNFADIRTTDEVMALLEKAPPAAEAETAVGR